MTDAETASKPLVLPVVACLGMLVVGLVMTVIVSAIGGFLFPTFAVETHPEAFAGLVLGSVGIATLIAVARVWKRTRAIPET